MAKGKERPVYYRAVKFEVVPSEEQLKILVRISENLRAVWNWALSARMEAYEAWKVRKAEGNGQEKEVKLPTLFDQINQLTALRESEEFAFSPRNWQEETLDRLNGSFLSFFTLVKNGDGDARPPRERQEGSFQVIPGRSGFAVKDVRVVFAPNIFGKDTLAFPIPEYCIRKLEAGVVKKFTLSRDEHDLGKKGRYWVSVVYEVAQPEMSVPVRGDHVYLSLGASSIGVLAKGYNGVIDLWRPDKHWKPLIESVEARLKTVTKGSKRWKRRMNARQTMFSLMRKQQRQDHREIVAELMSLGRHFVVTDYVVRSKKGKLADGDDATRGGPQGLNWAAQNTGSFLDLVMHLEEKVKEVGGSVVRHKLAAPPPRGIGKGRDNKIAVARHLRKEVEAVA